MGTILGGAFAIASLLAAVVMLTISFLTASTAQAASTGESWSVQRKTFRGTIEIISTSGGDSGGGTNVTVQVRNVGGVEVSDFDEMDLLVRYTKASGDQEVQRLVYVTANPSDGEWTVSGIAPDEFHPGIWDPDETAAIDLRVVPPLKSGANGTVAVVIPGGASDSAYFTN